MSKPLRIALVEYINTRPFLDGIQASFSEREIELLLLPPSTCAEALRDDRADVALLPAGAIGDFDQLEIQTDWCIGANGAVESVFLCAEQAVDQLDHVLLDRHSRSSNNLARVLLRHHWQREVKISKLDGPNFTRIKGKTGGIIIGDQAIRLRHQFPYVYDLSAHWKAMTGLPFAFAVWAWRAGTLESAIQIRLERALSRGVSQAIQSARYWAEHFGLTPAFAESYLTQAIDFRFDAAKHRALDLYLNQLVHLPEEPLPVTVEN